MKKTRADSILGTLTEERQAEIADYARDHSIKDTRAWLAADGIKVSAGAFSSWLSSWSLRQAFTQSESDANEFRDWLATSFPSLSEQDLDARAALMFQFQAVKAGDSETYLAFATARHKAAMDKAKFDQKERQLQLDIDKFQLAAAEKMLDRALQAKANEINSNADLSRADKIAAMRKAAFSDVDALEQSGEVQVPK